MNGLKDQCLAQTILKGERCIVMLLKFGQVNMKLDLENGRSANNVEIVEHFYLLLL